MEIKKVSQLLLVQYWVAIALALVMLVLGESGLVETGCLADCGQAEFYLLLLMEPLTLAAIFGALYLFKVRRVSASLSRYGASALLRWGRLRMLMLQLPLVLNTLFYYLFMKASFGYLAIMVLLAMFFVYPSLARCKTEIEK